MSRLEEGGIKGPFNGCNRLCPRKQRRRMEAKKLGRKQGDLSFQMTFLNQAESGGLGPGNNFKIETHQQSRPCDKFQDAIDLEFTSKRVPSDSRITSSDASHQRLLKPPFRISV